MGKLGVVHPRPKGNDVQLNNSNGHCMDNTVMNMTKEEQENKCGVFSISPVFVFHP